ncbi:PREDICTED: LOC110764017, partial [Prunus dulcis]
WCMAYGDWECPPGKRVVQHIPTHFQSIGSVKWGPISKEQEDEVEWVRAQLSEAERECGNLVTQKNLFESGLLQG